MSSINIQREHHLSLEELTQKINAIIVEIEEKLEFRSEWQSERLLSFRRKGANGTIEIDETKFELTLKLGLMFRMLKTVIHAEVIAVIDGHLK